MPSNDRMEGGKRILCHRVAFNSSKHAAKMEPRGRAITRGKRPRNHKGLWRPTVAPKPVHPFTEYPRPSQSGCLSSQSEVKK